MRGGRLEIDRTARRASIGARFVQKVAKQCRSVTDMPFKLRVDQAEQRAEIVTLLFGEGGRTHIPDDPIDNPRIGDRPTLGLQTLGQPQPQIMHIAQDLRVIGQVASQGVETRIVA